MNTAHASHVDSPAAAVASWYTPGRSDGFGDRLLMFDNTDAISLELLRFHRELASTPGFEHGLRDHVDLVARLRHPSFPMVRAVVYLDEEDLTLVSAHTPGQRLAELPTWKLHKGLHPAVVTWIVREITPALAALQAVAPGVSHGALNADRIVLTADGRLCIIEHVLAPPVRRLGLLATEFWRRFGLLAPTDERGLVRIDQRTDVVQLGALALSLLLARPVTLSDFEHRLPALLDEFSAIADISPSVFAAPCARGSNARCNWRRIRMVPPRRHRKASTHCRFRQGRRRGLDRAGFSRTRWRARLRAREQRFRFRRPTRRKRCTCRTFALFRRRCPRCPHRPRRRRRRNPRKLPRSRAPSRDRPNDDGQAG